MSVDPKYGRYCDECGRTIVKAHRIFENKDYCASCYPRVFVKRPCSACGATARVHRNASGAPLCRPCTLADRVCIRCEKPVPRAGILSDGKPVCPSCAPHFRIPHPCPSCGSLSTRLSAMPSLGIVDKICESCRRKTEHKTCSVCRKHRKVAATSEDGRACCAACIPGQATTHCCPTCGVQVAGAGTSRCRSCSNLDRIIRESDLLAAALTRDWVRDLCRRFAMWLHDRQPGSPGLINVFRPHQIFFERLDAQFSNPEELIESSLLATFGAAGLRKHALPSLFLADKLGIRISADRKSESADADRIAEKLRSAKKHPWGKLLNDFAGKLKESDVSMRTARLYLSTAEAFCSTAKPSLNGWPEGSISRFLYNKPGLRANLYRFVGHCKSAYGWQVSMPPKTGAKGRTTLPKTVSHLARLLEKVTDIGIESADKRILARIIAKALALPAAVVMQSHRSDFNKETTGIVFRVNGETIEIPPKLKPICDAFINRCD